VGKPGYQCDRYNRKRPESHAQNDRRILDSLEKAYMVGGHNPKSGVNRSFFGLRHDPQKFFAIPDLPPHDEFATVQISDNLL
jgi:hypothetical protein